MTGLVLKLKPFEKLLINGAILQNGPRATRLRVRTSGASVLRLRDALHPQDINTAAGKIYYIAQLAIAGEANAAGAEEEILALVTAALGAAPDDRLLPALMRAQAAATARKFYVVMRAMRPFLSADAECQAAP